MPSFVDLYIPRIKKDSNSIKEALLGSSSGSEKVEVLKDLFSKPDCWNVLPEKEHNYSDIVGCDGSSFAFTMRNGGKLGIVRALAKGKDEEERHLDLGIVQGKDFDPFLSNIMQYLEIKALREYTEKYSPEVLILDGSPISFLRHRITEFRVFTSKENKVLSFQYLENWPPSAIPVLMINELSLLFKLIEEKNILFIGLSKDSFVSQLQQLMLYDKLKNLVSNLPLINSEKRELIKKLREESSRTNIQDILESFKEKAEKYKYKPKNDWEKVFLILEMYLFPLSDPEAVNLAVNSAGYSCPIELSSNLRIEREKDRLIGQPTTTIKNKFGISKNSHSFDSDDIFIKETMKHLRKVDLYPSVITTFVKLTANSYPMRVDILGQKGKYWSGGKEYEKTKVDQKLEDAIRIVKSLYVNEAIHNSINWEIDQQVRITRKNAKDIYLRALEHEIGLSRKEFLSRRENRSL